MVYLSEGEYMPPFGRASFGTPPRALDGLRSRRGMRHPVGGVHFAFFGPEPASRCTCHQGGGERLPIGGRLTGQDAASDITDVGVAEIEPDATCE